MDKLKSEKFPSPADQESSKIPELEVRDNGNLIIISGSLESLTDTASRICKELDPGIFHDLGDSLKKGEELRPQGIYAVWIDLKRQELRIQNRNGRGNKTFNEKMLRAVENVL
jgi:hypothetical protein